MSKKTFKTRLSEETPAQFRALFEQEPLRSRADSVAEWSRLERGWEITAHDDLPPWYAAGDERRIRLDPRPTDAPLFTSTHFLRPGERGGISQVLQLPSSLEFLDERVYTTGAIGNGGTVFFRTQFNREWPHTRRTSTDPFRIKVERYDPRQFNFHASRLSPGLGRVWDEPLSNWSPPRIEVEVSIAGFHAALMVSVDEWTRRPFFTPIQTPFITLDDYSMLMLEQALTRHQELCLSPNISRNDTLPIDNAMRNLAETVLHLIHNPDLPVTREMSWHLVLPRDLMWYAQFLPCIPTPQLRLGERMLISRIWDLYERALITRGLERPRHE